MLYILKILYKSSIRLFFACLAFTFFPPVTVFASDIQAVLDSADGSSGFMVQDSANAPKVRILSNGNMGIGTTTPLGSLELIKTTGVIPVMVSSSASAHGDYFSIGSDGNVGINTVNPVAKLQLRDGAYRLTNTTDSKDWELAYDATGDYFYVNEVGVARHLVVTNGGNVGIGSLAPSQKLDVNGDVRIGLGTFNNASANTDLYVSGNVEVDGSVWLGDATTDNLTVTGVMNMAGGMSLDTLEVTNNIFLNTSTGNVGIGSTAADASVEIVKQSLDPYLMLSATAGGNGDVLVVTSAGNVGLGSSAPSQFLDVNGDVRIGLGTFNNASANTDLYLSGNLEVDGSVWLGDATADNLTVTGTFSQDGAVVIDESSVEALLVRKDGDTGDIFTVNTTSSLATLAGNLGIGTIASSASVEVVQVANRPYVKLSASNGAQGDVLAVTSSGNVGISSTAPGSKLDINSGDVRIGATGTFNNTSADEDLYVKGNLEIDGSVWLGDNAVADNLTVTGRMNMAGGMTLDTLEVTGNTFLNSANGNVGIGSTVADASLEVVKQSTDPYLMLSATAAGNGDVVMVTSAGNIGLGTVTPGQVLDVAGNTRVRGTNALILGDDNEVSINASAATNGELRFLTNSTEYMRLTSAGNVGIGSTAPSQLLDVNGDVRIGLGTFNNASANTDLFVTGNLEVDGSVWLGDAAADNLTVTGTFSQTGDANVSGNFGIGTTTPQTKLAVQGPVGIGTWTTQAGVGLSVQNGNVGIGTITPGQLVDINGSLRTTGTNAVYVGSDNSVGIQPSAASGGDLKLLTASIEQARITAGGNLGVGTTAPGSKVSILGALGVGDKSYAVDYAAPSAGAIIQGNVGIGTFNPLAKFIVASGNVGIGSLAPSQMLDVNGDVRIGLGTFNNASANTDLFVSGNLEVDGSVWLGDAAVDNLTVTGAFSLDGAYTVDTTDVEAFLVRKDGDTGDVFTVNTTSSLVSVTGNVGVGTVASSASIEVVKSGSVPYMKLSATGGAQGDVVVVTSAGNVGLGTVTPGQVLDVAGNTRVRGTNALILGDDNEVSINASAATNGELRFLTNNAEYMRLTSAGNVGIGSTAPSQLLDVNGDVRIGLGTFNNASSNTDLYVTGNLEVDGSSYLGDDALVDNLTVMGRMNMSGGMSLDTLEVTGNTFLNSANGNVGIGSTVADASLEVVKQSTDPYLMLSATAAGNGDVVMVTSVGNIGLGTVTPGQVLDVAGNTRVRGTNALILGDDNEVSINASATTNGELRFLTNSTEYMRLTSAGNVGIGSTAPSQLLDVNGDVRIGLGTFNNATTNTDLYVTGNLEVDGSVFLGDASADNLTVTGAFSLDGAYIVDTNDVEAFLVRKDGDAGDVLTVNTISSLVSVAGNIGVGTVASSASIEVVQVASRPYMKLSATGGAQGDVVVVTSAGNVGIGSTAPSQLLDVNGDVRVGLGTFNNPSSNADVYVTGNFEVDGSTWLGDAAADSLSVTGTFSQNGDSTVGGNFGVGTTTPQTKLAVLGPVGIGTWTTQPGVGLSVLNGNVGIGTITPGQLVDINGSLRTTGTNAVYVGSDNSVGIQPSAASGGDLKLLTASIEQARITAGGNLGVGTTAPGSKVSILGALGVGDKSYAVDYAAPSAGAIIQGNVGIGTFNPLAKFIVASGNVGIGSLSPSQMLDVNGDVRIGLGTFNNATTNTDLYVTGNLEVDGSVFLGDASADNLTVTGAFNLDGAYIVDTTDVEAFLVRKDGDAGDVFTVNTSASVVGVTGNVGIGTLTATGGALMVRGGNVGIGTLNTTTSAALYVQQTAAADAFRVDDIDGGDTSPFIIAADGNVGVGSVAPGQVLDVAGNTRVRGTNALILGDDNEVSINASTATNGELRFLTNATEYMRITSAGNVGIGSLAPSQLLDVNGDVRIGLGTFNNGSSNTDLYVTGNLEVDGSVFLGDASADNLTVTGAFNLEGAYVVDTTDVEAFLVRKDGDAGDVFTVNTTSSLVSVAGNLGVGTTASAASIEVVKSGSVPYMKLSATGSGQGDVVVVTSMGNVGIGSSAPSQYLDVNGDVRVGLGTFNNPSANTDVYVTGNLEVDGSVWLGDAAADNLTVTGTFSQTGNLGIGTTTPQALLAVQGGNVGIGTWTSDANRVSIVGAAAIGSATYANTAAPTNGLLVQGNVGIGTTAPSRLLEVSGANDQYLQLRSTTATRDVALEFTDGVSTSYYGLLGQSTAATNKAGIFHAGAVRLVVDGAGNIGIGTNSPNAKLSISGSGFQGSVNVYNSQYPYLVFQNSTTGTASTDGLFIGIEDNQFALIDIKDNLPLALRTNDVERIRIQSGGNIGIGTTLSTNRLDIASNVSIGTAYAGYETAPSNGLIVQGNVGIGSAAPSQMLDVNGDVRIGLGTFNNGSANNDLYVTGNLEVDGSVYLGDATADTLTVVGTTSYATFEVTGNTMLNTGGTGNVGIGSTAADASLEVVKQSTDPYLMLSATASGNGDVLMISSGANVGIGTVVPEGALIVKAGNVGISTIHLIPTALLHVQQTGAANAFRVDDVDGGDISSFIITSDGNVGIGSSAPGSILNINGDVRIGLGTFNNPSSNTDMFITGDLEVDGTIYGSVAGGAPDSAEYLVSAAHGGLTVEDVVTEGFAIDYTNGAGTGTFAWDATEVINNLTWADGSNATIDWTWNLSGTDPVMSFGSNAVGIKTGNLGVGTFEPNALLDVSSTALHDLFRLNDAGTGDTTPFIIDSTGNVGVGTTNPQTKLSILGGNVGIGTWTAADALDVIGNIRLNGNITRNTATAFNFKVGTSFLRVNFSNDDANAQYAFDTNALVGGMRLGGSGDFAGTMLQVNTGAAANIGLVVKGAASQTGDLAQWQNSAGAVLNVVTAAGNVGIGSAAPSQMLDVNGDVRIGLGTFNNGSSNNDLYVTGNLEVDGSVYLGDAVADTLTVSGQTSYASFEVTGNTFLNTVDGNVGIGSTVADASLEIVKQSTDPYLMLSATAGGNGDVLMVTSGGNIGIGSIAPVAPFDILTNVAGVTAKFKSINTTYGPQFSLDASAAGGNEYILVSTPSGNGTAGSNKFSIYDATNTAYRFILDNSGNVGIGSLNPVGKLDVIGDEVRIWTGGGTNTNALSSGELYVEGDLEVDGVIYGVLSSSSGTFSTLEVTGNTFLNTSTGNVGIGSTVADASLEIVKQSTDPYLMLSATVGGNGDVLIVDSSANIGIGTVLPNAGLDIKATFAFEPSAITAITAGGGITVTRGIMRIAGSGGAVDITANPQIVDGTADGQLVTLLGTSDANTVKLDNGTGLKLSSAVSFTMGNGDIMTLIYDQSADLWTELSRTNN